MLVSTSSKYISIHKVFSGAVFPHMVSYPKNNEFCGNSDLHSPTDHPKTMYLGFLVSIFRLVTNARFEERLLDIARTALCQLPIGTRAARACEASKPTRVSPVETAFSTPKQSEEKA